MSTTNKSTDNNLLNKLDTIKKLIKSFFDNIFILFDKSIEQVNRLYNKNYTNYELIAHIFFTFLLLIIGVILYWDNLYKSAKQSSKCSQIMHIIDNNLNRETPFVYNVMVINKRDVNMVLNKFAFILVYDFAKNTTKIIYGDDIYYDMVKYINPIAQSQEDKTSGENKNPFRYYSLQDKKKELNDINGLILQNDDYMFIPVDLKNRAIKNEIAKRFANFVKEYNKNQDISLNILNDIITAIDESNLLSI